MSEQPVSSQTTAEWIVSTVFRLLYTSVLGFLGVMLFVKPGTAAEFALAFWLIFGLACDDSSLRRRVKKLEDRK